MSNERHKYEYVVDPNADTAATKVVRMVGLAKKVLEIGSGPGSITRLLSEASKCHVTALEIDPDAIEKVQAFCDKVYEVDLNDGAWPDLLANDRFDVVVAADVLEHLYQPLVALTAMGKLVTDDGYVVVSLPHVGHASIVACLLDENFEYRDWGLLDRTHIRFFGLKNMQTLFSDAGLKIVAAEFVAKHPAETEFAPRWEAISIVARAAALSNPHGLVYQVVLKAVPVAAAGYPLVLMDVPVTQSALTPLNTKSLLSMLTQFARRRARRYLKPSTRVMLRSFSKRFGM